MNVFFFALFAAILFRQFKARMRGAIPFLFGARGTTLLLPLNYPIKIPSAELNLLVEIDSTEIESIEISKRTHHIYHRRSGSQLRATRIKSHICLDIRLRESLPSDFYGPLENVVRQEGFTGSPLYAPSSTQIEYVMPDQGLKLEEIRKLLKERMSAVCGGTVSKSSIRLLPSENLTPDFILAEAHRQFCLGDRIIAAGLLDALLPDQSEAAMDAFRNQPLFEKHVGN